MTATRKDAYTLPKFIKMKPSMVSTDQKLNDRHTIQIEIGEQPFRFGREAKATASRVYTRLLGSHNKALQVKLLHKIPPPTSIPIN